MSHRQVPLQENPCQTGTAHGAEDSVQNRHICGR